MNVFAWWRDPLTKNVLTFVSSLVPRSDMMHNTITPCDITWQRIIPPDTYIVTILSLPFLFWNPKDMAAKSSWRRGVYDCFSSLQLQKSLIISRQSIFPPLLFSKGYSGIIAGPYSVVEGTYGKLTDVFGYLF